MDKYGTIDQNWYSPEAEKRRRENAEIVLEEFKQKEKLHEKTRSVIIEKTEYGGTRKRYVKKKNHENK